MAIEKNHAPMGELFSRAYAESAEPVLDSAALRNRLAAYVSHDLFKDHWDLSVHLKKETGQSAPTWSANSTLYHKFDEYLASVPRDQFLNLITHIWRFLKNKHQQYSQRPNGNWDLRSKPAEEWKAFVERVLREENIGYVLDEQCGVRFQVDRQFELQHEAALSCLAEPRFSAALAAFEDAHRYFASTPQDLKAALRALFESVEIVAKQMYSADRLTAKLVTNDIKNRILTSYSNDPVARRAIGRVIDGFADWVDGMHHYRHGQGDEEPVVPPASFAVYAMSSGAAFIRWLVQVEKGACSE